MTHSPNTPAGALHRVLIAILAVMLAACGGDSSDDSGSPNPPAAGGGDNGSIQVSPEGELAAKEAIVIEYETAADPDSLQLDGSLAELAQPEWSEDNRKLTLTPSTYWSAGTQTLSVDTTDSSGNNQETVDVTFDVASAFPTFHSASVVIGQPDFANNESRQGGAGADANTLDAPMGPVAYADEQDILFVPDNGDSRVLGFDGIPDTNNAAAAFVIGQPNFNLSTGATTASTYRNPQWITTSHERLLVADSESRRVLVYDGIPETGPVDASLVVGQPDMTSFNIRCDQRTVYTTHGHFVTPEGRLFIADSDNNRVLMWNEIPAENYAPADLVFGQPDFESCNAFDEPGGSDDMRAFNHPTAIWSDDERVIIVDNENHRIFIWNTFPDENYAEPDVILGQDSFDTVAPNDVNQDGVEDSVPSASTLYFPWDVFFHNGQLFVSDQDNNRVLIWNEMPESSFAPADIVIGQEDFESNQPNAGNVEPGANTLNGPRGATIIGDRIFITDTRNSRILIYESE